MAAGVSVVPKLRRIDELCDRFEQEWLDGRQPTIETYLARDPSLDRTELLRRLLEVEIELRRGDQQLPGQNEYLRRFPEFHQVIVDAFSDEPSPDEEEVVFAEVPRAPTNNFAAEQIVMQVIAGPHKGVKFTFDKHDLFLVGRSARAHLQLAGDPHFSRFHFRLEVNPPMCYLIDLGSRNGTFVNGEPVQECHLKSGDVISGGMTELQVMSNSAEQTLAMPLRKSELPALPKPSQPEAPRIVPQLAAAMTPPPTAAKEGAIVGDVTIPLPVIPEQAGGVAFSGALSIPGYEFQQEIGKGDLGTVYKAVQSSLGRTVALKVMTPAVSVADKALQLFVRECSVLSQLNHPHIVRLLDQGSANGHLFLATEFVPTIKLEDQLRSRPLAERIRLCCGLMQQVLSALQYAHNRSLVHRDIKPGNVLISKEGRTLAAKLSDFGVAKQYTNAGFSQITRAGDVIGSLPYMPPEQFLNSREARPSCDLYAAGATLYQWLSGHTPHDFPPGRSQFLVVLEDAPVPIATRLPEIPRPLAAFLDRSLARQPEQRFTSADQMRHALKEALKE